MHMSRTKQHIRVNVKITSENESTECRLFQPVPRMRIKIRLDSKLQVPSQIAHTFAKQSYKV